MRYDRRMARHEVEWTVKDSGNGRSAKRKKWVDFAEDMVYREVAAQEANAQH
jgi:hypothetical protein